MTTSTNDIEPSVSFDPTSGLLKIEGRSSMREPLTFYQPLIDEVTNTTVPTFIVDLKLEHFNTGTMKCLFQLMKVLKDKQSMGAMLMIRWFSDDGDEDHIELGEDLENRAGLKFQYVNN